jgi:hypothetical protein
MLLDNEVIDKITEISRLTELLVSKGPHDLFTLDCLTKIMDAAKSLAANVFRRAELESKSTIIGLAELLLLERVELEKQTTIIEFTELLLSGSEDTFSTDCLAKIMDAARGLEELQKSRGEKQINCRVRVIV